MPLFPDLTDEQPVQRHVELETQIAAVDSEIERLRASAELSDLHAIQLLTHSYQQASARLHEHPLVLGCLDHRGPHYPKNIRYYIRSGINGAENELLHRIDEDRAAERFSTLVIASGDHAFAELAMRANHAGMTTWRVRGNGTQSQALERACSLHAHLKVSRADRLRTSRTRLAEVA
ncbi:MULTISPECIES: hypothetical protein [Aeromicrobium]|uniref:hypothetical protein n=1 Tax=Aeromicrobium TaxID=2040 RepID=UPI00257CA897|nr:MULTISPECIES: hypothetical protein [Aeromicrobium]